MSWVLIVIWSVSGSQAAVAMQEFASVEACQFASTQIKQRSHTQWNTMVCVPKGRR